MALTKIKAKEKKGIVEVKAMTKHEMLSHQEAKRAKKEPNWITYLVAKSAGKVVYEVTTSQFLSKNPYLKFSFKGKKGDDIEISWVDLKGNKDTSTSQVK